VDFVRAGELRQRIIIEQNTPTRDSFSAEVPHWSTVATLWAKIETVSGAETIEQQQAAARLTHNMTIRYTPGLAPAMRVSWNSRLFDIQAIIDDNKKHEMMLVCAEAIHA
jgi:SPP1 family predicted phage head-tail adaptor